MYLYDKYNDKLNIYKTSIDNEQLKEYKKRFLNDIMTAKIHTNDQKIKETLFESNTIMFHAIDHFDKEKNTKSYIELTNNKDIIEDYLNGKLDDTYVLNIAGNPGVDKAKYSELENRDYAYLFSGGHYFKDFETDDNILLKGPLSDLQPILYGDLLDMTYLTEWNYDKDFFKMMKYRKVKTINYKDLEYAETHELVHEDPYLETKLERSELVLKLINKANPSR